MIYAAPTVPVVQYDGTNSQDILDLLTLTYIVNLAEDVEEANGVLSFTWITSPYIPWDRMETEFSFAVGDWIVFKDYWYYKYSDTEFREKYIINTA